MMIDLKIIVQIPVFFLLFTLGVSAQTHPSLMLSPQGVREIRAKLGQVPLFDRVLEETKQEVDAALALGIEVPVPKDMAGGYTHERHKKNWFVMQKAGLLFQLTGEEKYAIYIRDMLLAYAKLYPTLSIHPTNRSYATGKIFWQCLNDANWLVYVSQAYDCVYDWLQPEERTILERDLFRPYADFLSVANPQFFNRIHNHSTWANAAVGMIGLVMNDQELVKRALYGLPQDDIAAEAKDNDGGFIKLSGQNQAGFLAQLDYSFSPDGYFTEGPYYLRYAIYPFLLFAKSLAANRPDLDILHYRDSILKKATYALLNQTQATGEFFPINDAQKGMSWLAREVITAVDVAYFTYGKDKRLLSIAQQQQEVLLDESGFAVAQDLEKGLAEPFRQWSVEYQDGPDGEQGGVGILRSGNEEAGEICLVMKYSAQGMGHGHFDKLSYSLYDEVGEILQDYGAARWVNIDQKGGGRYLPENNSWAKQSIAHNTVVINETSHYNGDLEKGEAHHPDPYFFSAESEQLQIVSAKDVYAYPGTSLQRTMILLKEEHFRNPLVIDLFKVQSDSAVKVDLPSWFQGHLLSTNFPYEAETKTLVPLGESHGYQHLWKEAGGHTEPGNAQLTWFANGKFYSLTAAVAPEDELIFARIGANDPSFNLRHDPAFIIRKKDVKSALFASVIESHGDYNPVAEIPHTPFGNVTKVQVLHDDERYTAIRFSDKSERQWTLFIANQDASKKAKHQLTIDGNVYNWQGPLELLKKE